MEPEEQKELIEPKNFWETNKNVLILIVTISILIVSGIAMFFVLQKDNFPTNQVRGKCGDGICDEIEKANPELCPEDCEISNSEPQLVTNGSCGDGVCEDIEKGKCLEDCGNAGEINQDTLEPLETINFHYLDTGEEYGSSVKLNSPAIDPEERKLYVMGTKTTYLSVIDLDTDTKVDSFDIGTYGGFMLYSDGLYNHQFEQGICTKVDFDLKKAVQEDLEVCASMMPEQGDKEWNGYVFREKGYHKLGHNSAGFTPNYRQDLNGAYGVTEIYDSSDTDNKLGEIVHGVDALYFVIDEDTGKMYFANTGESMVKVFDLNKLEETEYCKDNSCYLKSIDVGTSADEVVVDSEGTIYTRSRLGENAIFKYSAGDFDVIQNENILSDGLTTWNTNEYSGDGIGMWPTGMALSKDESNLYVLSHYGAKIDVIDTSTNKVINSVEFYPDYVDLQPRTDSISTMAINKETGLIYVSWPELGVIGISDGENVVDMIDLTDYGLDRSTVHNSGQGQVNLAIDEKNNKLYVYIYQNKKLLKFNGVNLEKEKIVESIKQEKILYVSDDYLFYKNKKLDLDTLEEIDTFSKGERVIAVNEEDVLLVESVSKGQGIFYEMLYYYSDGKLINQYALSDIGQTPSDFYFDSDNNMIYRALFVYGIVEKYDSKKIFEGT